MKLNIFTCGGAGCNNTGTPTCQFTPSAVKQVILVPKGTKFSEADAENFDTVLEALGKNDDPSQRAYPIGMFVEAESTSSEAVVTESGYGVSSFVRDGKIRFNWRINTGLCYWSKIRGFNNQQDSYDVLLVDVEQRAIWGTQNTDGTFSGFSMSMLLVPQFTLNDGTERTYAMIDIQFEDMVEFENFAVVQFDSTVKVNKLVEGLQDAKFKVISALDAGGGVLIEVRTACGHVDMVEDFDTELLQTGAWLATNADTGAVIPVLGVSLAGNQLRIELDISSPNYPASGDGVIINLQPVSVLEGLATPLEGIEGCEFSQVAA